jgi:adenylate cyclase
LYSPVEKLVADAELQAERIIGVVRATVAAILFAWITVSFQLDAPADQALVEEPALVVGAVLGGFLLLGLASYVLARTRLFRPWMAFAFTAVDAVVISLGLFVVLDGSSLAGNWLPVLPGVWVGPLLLALGALRYRPAVQVWTTVLLVLGFAAAITAAGFDPGGPSRGADAPIAHLLSTAPMLVRGVFFGLTGLIAALGMRRARALLIRAVTETLHRANLSRLLPAEIAPLVDTDRLEEWRRGRRQQVAILFVDIRDSTTLAESMDPTRLSVFLASFRRRLLRAAEANGGVVDKFIGDGALIVFGIPEPRPDDCKRALACARELLREIAKWNLKRGFIPPVRVGIGLHAGHVYCGLVGDDARLEFTVLGDVVNVAARIEQATKQFNTPLLASEAVVTAAGELNAWEIVGIEQLRGRADPVTLLAPMPRPGTAAALGSARHDP